MIQQAAERARKWDTKTDKESSDSSHISNAEVDPVSPSVPKISGVFDYAQWIVDKLETEQHYALRDVFQEHNIHGSLRWPWHFCDRQ